MKPVLPAKVRSAIYLVTGVVTPVVVYLGKQGVINDFWTGLYSVTISAILALAYVNVTPDQE
jgi:hypothetical protein